MATVKFTSALYRFFPELTEKHINAPNVRELVEAADKDFPGLKGYILDDQGNIRKHVNIFVDGTVTEDVNVAISDTTEVYIIQALSGGE